MTSAEQDGLKNMTTFTIVINVNLTNAKVAEISDNIKKFILL